MMDTMTPLTHPKIFLHTERKVGKKKMTMSSK